MRSVIALAIVALLAGGAQAKSTRERCTTGRFMITGAASILGQQGDPHGPLVLSGGRVALGPSCRAVRARLSGSKRGTEVRARWPKGACDGLGGPLRLEARIPSGCASMSGVLKTVKPRRSEPLTSLASACGDGIVDPGNDETCDGAGCGAGEVCDRCRCIALPPPTVVTTSTSTTSPTSSSTTTSVTVSSTTSTQPATTTTTTPTSSSTTTTRPLSVARRWDDQALEAIRRDTPRPTVHARNLFHLSVAMWDAWAAFDVTADQYMVQERAMAADVEAARREAISYAAYRVLSERYAHSPGAAASRASFDELLAALGYDENNTSTTGDSPAALGNRIAAAVLSYGYSDGANEGPLHTYADPSYTPVNAPLVVKLPIIEMIDPSRWQPLALDYFVTQNGLVEPISSQVFIGSQWGAVKPFGLTRSDPADIYLDPGAPPAFGGSTHDEFREQAIDVLRKSSQLTPDDGVVIDVSPGAAGNNALGTDTGAGHPVNPVTGAPYAPNLVKRGDWARVLAEYWADGPHSETPPGHWNVIANDVTDRLPEKRIGGTGPLLGDLEWDVKLYLALNGAVHDAAIGCWGTKRHYDTARPISMIRYLAKLGQSSDPMLPRYHPLGLPLVPGFIELITGDTTAPGARHASLVGFEDEIAVRAWPGQPAIPLLQYSGAQWVLGRKWLPYQKNTFVTPAFASYTSGHSTYSRASAEVLTVFTGSAFFPGGLGEFTARRDTYLTFELGPSQDVQLQWATYYDAADQAGQSRLWGGIHIAADDFGGRRMGSRVGLDAVALAQRYFDGTALP